MNILQSVQFVWMAEITSISLFICNFPPFSTHFPCSFCLTKGACVGVNRASINSVNSLRPLKVQLSTTCYYYYNIYWFFLTFFPLPQYFSSDFLIVFLLFFTDFASKCIRIIILRILRRIFIMAPCFLTEILSTFNRNFIENSVKSIHRKQSCKDFSWFFSFYRVN